MDTYIVFWLAATVVFVLVELKTVGLTSIWFAAGSFVAFIIALLGGNVVVQGIAFILVSVVLLALTKPWACRKPYGCEPDCQSSTKTKTTVAANQKTMYVSI